MEGVLPPIADEWMRGGEGVARRPPVFPIDPGRGARLACRNVQTLRQVFVGGDEKGDEKMSKRGHKIFKERRLKARLVPLATPI